MIILGNIFTVISYCFYFISISIKNKNLLLVFDILSRLFGILSFIILDAINGVINSIFSFFRALFGLKLDDKDKKYKHFWFIILLLIYVIFQASTYAGVKTIFVFITGLINLFTIIYLDAQQIRFWGIIGGLSYLLFHLTCKNYTGCICELIAILIRVISYIKWNKQL